MTNEILTGREALEKAFAETAVDEPEAAGETVDAVAETPSDDTPSEPTPDGRERDEFGRFKPKEAAAETDPAPVEAPAPIDAAVPDDAILPQLNDPRAKAAWGTADPALKAEVGKRIGELQGGIERYRAEMEPIRRYADMARQSGTTLDAALANYTHIEQTIARNPVEGLDLICRNLGTDIRTVAAQIMGQPAPEPNQQIAQMRQQMGAMQQELRGYRAERERTVSQQVQDFAKGHPRLDELSGKIKWLLETGGASDLEDAYRTAEYLSPVATARTGAPEPVAARNADAAPKGPVSIKGAPSTGSNPARGTESLSSRDAVARAFASLR
jgi:hypothetical protein